MENEKTYEGLISCPATDVNFQGGLDGLSFEDLMNFRAALVEREGAGESHKGRIKAVERELKRRGTNSTEVVALDNKNEDIMAAEELYADGMPYELERLENEIKFFQDAAGKSLLEMGKRLIRIKAHEGHGGFLTSLERLNMTPRTAQYAMAAARRFANRQLTADLESEKIRVLTVLDDDEIDKLENGGTVRGIKVDDIERM